MFKDVLLVTPFYDPNIVGGAEVSTQILAEGLCGRADVLTFCPHGKHRVLNGVDIYEMDAVPSMAQLWQTQLGQDCRESRANRIKRYRLSTFPDQRVTAKYLEFLNKHDYKCIILNTNEDIMARPSLWKASNASGAKVILTLRDPMLVSRKNSYILSKIYRSIVTRQMKWIDRFVAPSRYMIELYAKNGLHKERSVVIPNAVDMPVTKNVAFSKKAGVIYAGSIRSEKGVLTLVDASKHFHRNERLELIGRGPLSDSCKAMDNIVVIDWMEKSKLYSRIAEKKVLVLPSEWPEAFGRVLIEAVNSGTLIVGSRVGGIPEILEGDERYLFRQGDSCELANRVNRILGLDSEEYEKELHDLRKRFERYSLKHYIHGWSTLIDEVCQA